MQHDRTEHDMQSIAKMPEVAPVFIAAPIFSDKPSTRARHHQRALLMGQLAALQGYAPLVWQTLVIDGAGAPPYVHGVQLVAVARELLKLIMYRPHGQIWVLDPGRGGTMPIEVLDLLELWGKYRNTGIYRATWAELRWHSKEFNLQGKFEPLYPEKDGLWESRS